LEKSTSNTHDKNSRGSVQPDGACGAQAATTPSAWDDTEKQNPTAPAVRDDALYIPTSTNAVPDLEHFWRVQVDHSSVAPKWVELTHFIKHPVIELSTNWAENSMRPVAIGRRNWLHLGSKEAGPKIAAIFSIVESCRKLGVPIRQYLANALPGLADRSIHGLADITPTAYATTKAK
jgi:hypothetical protein